MALNRWWGPSLGGVLYAVKSSVPFLVDAASYLVSVVSLFFIRTPFQKPQTQQQGPLHLWKDMGAGLAWMWRQPLLFFMALMTGGNVFVGAGYTLIIIVIAQSHHAPASAIGVIFGIGGIGAIVGGIIAPFLQKRFSFAQLILATVWFFAVVWAFLIFTPDVWGLALIDVGGGVVSTIYNVVYVGYRLSLTPDHLQGRVNSVARLFANALGPLGAAVIGILLQQSGPVVTALLCALELALLALLASINPHVRSKWQAERASHA